MEEIRICSIPVDRSECEDKRRKCSECPYNSQCDCYWVGELWQAENKKFKKDSLLGPYNPAFVKPDFRAGHVLTVGDGKDNFCCFNNPVSKSRVTIGDIYVDDSARGKGISKKIISWLINMSGKGIFAKCVRGTSAEAFWSHVGKQIDANEKARGGLWFDEDLDMYEHREGKRDLGWYVVDKEKYLNH